MAQNPILNHDYQSKEISENITKHNFKAQAELHQTIKNDDDYDDWEYGTEPTYGISV